MRKIINRKKRFSFLTLILISINSFLLVLLSMGLVFNLYAEQKVDDVKKDLYDQVVMPLEDKITSEQYHLDQKYEFLSKGFLLLAMQTVSSLEIVKVNDNDLQAYQAHIDNVNDKYYSLP